MLGAAAGFEPTPLLQLYCAQQRLLFSVKPLRDSSGSPVKSLLAMHWLTSREHPNVLTEARCEHTVTEGSIFWKHTEV